MDGIFISHCTQNRALVELVVDFLQAGMGIGREQIFCTSLNGALPTGGDFVTVIRNKMIQCRMVLALISPEYLQSPFCLMELGAAWVQSAYLCPVLTGNMDYKDLDGTPLKSIQMRKLASEEDLFAIFDEMLNQKIITVADTLRFYRKVPEFFEKCREMYDGRIYPDELNVAGREGAK